MSLHQKPVWVVNGLIIRQCRLVEPQPQLGTVEIAWSGKGGEHSLWLDGNLADDFMEQYRAAPDAIRRTEVMVSFIAREALP